MKLAASWTYPLDTRELAFGQLKHNAQWDADVRDPYREHRSEHGSTTSFQCASILKAQSQKDPGGGGGRGRQSVLLLWLWKHSEEEIQTGGGHQHPRDLRPAPRSLRDPWRFLRERQRWKRSLQSMKNLQDNFWKGQVLREDAFKRWFHGLGQKDDRRELCCCGGKGS